MSSRFQEQANSPELTFRSQEFQKLFRAIDERRASPENTVAIEQPSIVLVDQLGIFTRLIELLVRLAHGGSRQRAERPARRAHDLQRRKYRKAFDAPGRLGLSAFFLDIGQCLYEVIARCQSE